MSNPWVDPRMTAVTPEDIRSYLLARGWKLAPQSDASLLVFEGPSDDDGRTIVQVLPSSAAMRDFALRSEELIGALAVFEDRPASDVLSDVLRAGSTQAPVPATSREGGTVASK